MELLAQWLLLWIPSTLALLYILTREKARDPRHGRLPPGPKPLPIVGNLLELGDQPHRSLARLARTYGPLMALKLGQVTTVVVTSPEMAREVLQKRDQAFSSRQVPDVLRVFGLHETSVVWLPAGQTWRNLRKICSTKLFMSQRINDNHGLKQNKARDLVKYVRECCLAGEAVDIGRAAHTTVLNMISSIFFSIDLGDTSSESAQNFRDLVRKIMVEVGSPNLSDYFPVLAAIDLQGRRRRMADYVGKLYNIFDELIDQRMQAKEGRVTDAAPTDDLLDSLIHCYILDSDLKVDRRAVKSLLLDLFVAGTDTSPITIEWVMTELLRNPNSMEKARQELIKTIGSKMEVDMSDIQQLHYLQAIVKETLRLHPPDPLLVPHMAETSVELSGYTISKGSQVLVNVWAIGRDGDVWTDPELFMPERFLGRNIDYKGQDFELIPFGAGRRICPGLPLAFQMVHLTLASLLLPFKWKLPNGMEPVDVNMDEKFGISLGFVCSWHRYKHKHDRMGDDRVAKQSKFNGKGTP